MKLYPAVLLLAAAAGFAFVATRTKAKDAAPSTGAADHRAEVYARDGRWYAQVYANGEEIGDELGPVGAEDEAEQIAADYLAALAVRTFYVLRVDPAARTWSFVGFHDGQAQAPRGPFASQAAASTAASAWARSYSKLPGI